MRPLVLALLVPFAACDSSQPPSQPPPPTACTGSLAGGVSGTLSGCFASAAVSPTTGSSFLRLTHAAATVMGAGDLSAELDVDQRLAPVRYDQANARTLTAELDVGGTTYRAAAGSSIGDPRGAATLTLSALGPADSYGVLASVDGTLTATLVADDPAIAPITASLTF